MTNIHSFGSSLQDEMRGSVSAHQVTYVRKVTGEQALTVAGICVSSPPIGRELLTDTGLDLNQTERTFIIRKSDIFAFVGEPRVGDLIIDESDRSTWRVLPQGTDSAWKWHGQMRTAFLVRTKQETTYVD
jgi:hypothetical protein